MVKSGIDLLLVEDNPGDARLILEMLKESSQVTYNVITSGSMSSAISNLQKYKFYIIILDLNLPDSSGLETLDIVIKDTGGRVPIIVMTGIDDEETGVSAIEQGAEDYIVKGAVNSAQMIRSIRYAIERKKMVRDLQESGERFRRLHESMIDAFVEVDMNGLIVSYNTPYFEMLGFSEEELNHLTYADLTPEKWHVFEMDIVKNEILKDGHSAIYEKEYRRKDGTVFPVELRTSLLIDPAGKPIGMWAIVRDITERKQAAEALRESEEKYRIVVEKANDGIAIVQNGIISFANFNCAHIGGYEVENLTGSEFLRFIPEENQAFYKERFLKRIAGESIPSIYETVFVGKSGKLVPVELNASIIQYKKRPADLVIIRDITGRKQMEETLTLRSVAMENAANAIVITDAAGTILWANPAFEKLTLYSSSEIVGRNPGDFIKSGKHGIEFYKQLWKTITSGSIWSGEIINKKKDGSLYTEEMTIAPVKNVFGEIQNYVAIKQDITERIKILEDLKISLNEKRELIREIYHRTKNNMQVIISMFSLQSILTGDDKLERVLKDMENRIRAISLVHEKLYQSKNLSKLDLKDYLTELVHNILSGYSITVDQISVTEQMENIEVLIDTAIPCGLVVNELISNVARHAFPSGENGELVVKLTIDAAGEIELIVADNGKGSGMNLDIYNIESMGIQIIRNIVEYQLKGGVELDTADGIKWTIKFKDNIYEERI